MSSKEATNTAAHLASLALIAGDAATVEKVAKKIDFALAEVFDEAVREVLDCAVRDDDGITLHYDCANPYSTDLEYDDDLDGLAAEIYNMKAQSPQEMTPQRWARIKRKFPQSARICREEAEMEDLDD